MKLLIRAAGAALALLTPASLEAASPDPPPTIASMALPSGPLQLIGHNGSVVFFIDPANLRKSGTTVVVRVYRVFSPSFAGFGESLQSVSDWSVDCVGLTRSTLGEQVFGENGKFRFWNEPEAASVANGAVGTVAKVACGLAPPPPMPSVLGGPALMSFSQALLASPRVIAPGDPSVGLRVLMGPSKADFAAVMPAAARPSDEPPAVTLLCVGGDQGTLKACAVSSESPSGLGFGQAALGLASKIRVASYDPARSTDGAIFPFVIKFPNPN
jgi:hypothetical protein